MSTLSTSSRGLFGNFTASLLAPLAGAVLLGAVIIFGVGFSSASAAHNAAHDVRHANAFPCH